MEDAGWKKMDTGFKIHDAGWRMNNRMTEKKGSKDRPKKPMRYRDLEIYQLSHRLAVEIHKMSLDLPRFEMFEEGNQIRKSSKGIPAHIVEGFGRRRYKNDFIRFLVYAHSSCDETIEHLQLLFDTESIDDKNLIIIPTNILS